MTTSLDPQRLAFAYAQARDDLLAERSPDGHWVGELSSSAVSTATAISALSLMERYAVDVLNADEAPDEGTSSTAGASLRSLSELIVRGLEYLVAVQNDDGGWGDTDKSHSNIATTMLVRAAFHLTTLPSQHDDVLEQADQYILDHGGVEGVRRRYGRDKTFAVPILANCALAGMIPWSEVTSLPFELACLPSRCYRFLRLPVVSYAIPALVAVGQLKFHCDPPKNPLLRMLRRAAVNKSLAVLGSKQPSSGGFLEAIPLTSFVVMSLTGTGRANHPVTIAGLGFLLDTVRADGSWPIDTNLSMWCTSLSANALAAAGEDISALGCTDWLLNGQYRTVHPYTDTSPGGWAWTDLPGGVPDADDTAGALLALAEITRLEGSSEHALDPPAPESMEPATFASRQGNADEDAWQYTGSASAIHDAAVRGIDWLLELQNRDGGWPTFCRGWGKLPFDRSGTDLTAHAIRALAVWRSTLEADRSGPYAKRRARLEKSFDAILRGLSFLNDAQRANGSWIPLWFGNQHEEDEENPVYGTARVLLAHAAVGRDKCPAAQEGVASLLALQNTDGGWGGSGNAPWNPRAGHRSPVVSSVEETALAVDALITIGGEEPSAAVEAAIERGLAWLVEAVETGRHRDCSPIGFYFAKLWYYERLYPLIFTVAALGRGARRSLPEELERVLTPAQLAGP